MITVSTLLATFVVAFLTFTTGAAWWWGRDVQHEAHRWQDPFMALLLFVGGVMSFISLVTGFLAGVGIVK